MNFPEQNGQIPMRPVSPVFVAPILHLLFSFLSIASAEAQAHRTLACPIEDSCDGYQLAKNIFAETLKFQTCFVFSVEIKTSFLVELGCSITCMPMNPQLGPSQPSILIS